MIGVYCVCSEIEDFFPQFLSSYFLKLRNLNETDGNQKKRVPVLKKYHDNKVCT
jgi:hypothetical protein